MPVTVTALPSRLVEVQETVNWSPDGCVVQASGPETSTPTLAKLRLPLRGRRSANQDFGHLCDLLFA